MNVDIAMVHPDLLARVPLIIAALIQLGVVSAVSVKVTVVMHLLMVVGTRLVATSAMLWFVCNMMITIFAAMVAPATATTAAVPSSFVSLLLPWSQFPRALASVIRAVVVFSVLAVAGGDVVLLNGGLSSLAYVFVAAVVFAFARLACLGCRRFIRLLVLFVCLRFVCRLLARLVRPILSFRLVLSLCLRFRLLPRPYPPLSSLPSPSFLVFSFAFVCPL